MNISSYTTHTAMLYRRNGLNKIKQAGTQNRYRSARVTKMEIKAISKQ